MRNAKEVFNDLMQNPEWKAWYDTRPETVKELAQHYPFTKYRIKDGAPYAITCPGSIVHLQAYSESGAVRVALFTQDILPQAIEHIKSLRNGEHVLTNQLAELSKSGISAHVNPKFLEPIEE